MRTALRALLLVAPLLGCATAPPGTPGVAPLPAPSADARPLPAPTSEPERVVLIAIHGLRPSDYAARAPAPGAAPLPTLTRLAGAGIAAEAVEPVFPPSPYPALTSLVTGRRPGEHGIPADARIGQRGVRNDYYDHASAVRGTTLWQAATAAGLPVASLDWPATGGAAIADLVPDLGPGAPTGGWLAALAERAGPRVASLAAQAGGDDPDAALPGAVRDRVLGEVACGLLVGPAAPRLLLLRLSQTEAALRIDPPGSPPVRRAFAGADAEVGRLLDCLAEAGLLASTAVVVAGDHGTVPVHTTVLPNGVLERVGLIVAIEGAISSWDALARSNGGSAFVYATDAESALLARRALQEEADRTGAFRVLSAEEMYRRGADPEAWFGLEAQPGFAFDDAPLRPTVMPARLSGTGGYAPDLPEMAAGLVAWGAGLRGPLRVPAMRQTDVAPTLARLLGIPLGDTEGRALVGLLVGGGARLQVQRIAPNLPAGTPPAAP